MFLDLGHGADYTFEPPKKPKWRNWQTRTTQNRVPNGHEGSIPSFGTDARAAMKKALFAVCLLLIAAACTGATDTTQTSPSPTRTTIPTPVPSTPTPADLNLPAWVADPEADVLLTLVDGAKPDSYELSLFNAETMEAFPLPYENIGGYFWTPDGLGIGLMEIEGDLILIDAVSGDVQRIALKPSQTRFVEIHARPKPFLVTGNDASSSLFLVLSQYAKISPNGNYILCLEECPDDQMSVYEVSTGRSRVISSTADDLVDLGVLWMPSESGSQLSFQQASVSENGERQGAITIYDVSTGAQGTQYRDLPFRFPGQWNADGLRYLYQKPSETQSEVYFETGELPCIANVQELREDCLEYLIDLHERADSWTPFFAHFDWTANYSRVAYIYYLQSQDYSDPNHGGICFSDPNAQTTRCILEDLAPLKPAQPIFPFNYLLSPSEEHLVFMTTNVGPGTDNLAGVAIGFANVESGDYGYTDIAEPFDSNLTLGLWRPLIIP